MLQHSLVGNNKTSRVSSLLQRQTPEKESIIGTGCPEPSRASLSHKHLHKNMLQFYRHTSASMTRSKGAGCDWCFAGLPNAGKKPRPIPLPLLIPAALSGWFEFWVPLSVGDRRRSNQLPSAFRPLRFLFGASRGGPLAELVTAPQSVPNRVVQVAPLGVSHEFNPGAALPRTRI